MSNNFVSVKQENEKRVTECLNKYGVFFAFNKNQMREKIANLNLKDGEKVSNLGAGMFCKSTIVDEFINDYKNVCKRNNQILIDKVGINDIIRYELANYECYYTGEIDDAVEALESYDIKDIVLIKKIFNEEQARHYD